MHLGTGGTRTRSIRAFMSLGAHFWCCNSPKREFAKIFNFRTSKIGSRLNPPKVTVLTVYSIGESGDPCGIPVGVGINSVVIPLNRIRVVLLLRKESTHCVISRGILRLRMLWMSRL